MIETTPSQIDVAIIGGGIGGLSTALALQNIGIEAHVFEQAPAYGEVGGHLTMDEAAMNTKIDPKAWKKADDEPLAKLK